MREEHDIALAGRAIRLPVGIDRADVAVWARTQEDYDEICNEYAEQAVTWLHDAAGRPGHRQWYSPDGEKMHAFTYEASAGIEITVFAPPK